MKRLVTILALIAGFHCDAEENAHPDNGMNWKGEVHRDVVYKEVDGRKLTLDVYMPAGSKPENAPLIYFVHGGGWAAGNKEKFGNRITLPVFRQLAEKGFVCASVSYRLCKPGRNVVMRDCVTDAMDGLRFLKKNAGLYGLDPEKIVVFGESAGGQIAQILTYAEPESFVGDKDLAQHGVRPVAGISWYGPTDFTDVKLFETDLSDKLANRFGDRITGGKGGYAENPEAFKEMSSYFQIRKDSPPLLLMQGDTDATIPFPHAPHLKKKADSIGADVRMVIVKNAGHNWRKAGGDPDPGLEEIQTITAEYALQYVESKGTDR